MYKMEDLKQWSVFLEFFLSLCKTELMSKQSFNWTENKYSIFTYKFTLKILKWYDKTLDSAKPEECHEYFSQLSKPWYTIVKKYMN